jgi:hypothetical protein
MDPKGFVATTIKGFFQITSPILKLLLPWASLPLASWHDQLGTALSLRVLQALELGVLAQYSLAGMDPDWRFCRIFNTFGYRVWDPGT